jgi:hypothetical protein
MWRGSSILQPRYSRLVRQGVAAICSRPLLFFALLRRGPLVLSLGHRFFRGDLQVTAVVIRGFL